METVEVFKTNVKDPDLANLLVDHIHQTFPDYKANFDLEDCDKILRVETNGGLVEARLLITLLLGFGFQAEVLPDELQPVGGWGRTQPQVPSGTGAGSRREKLLPLPSAKGGQWKFISRYHACRASTLGPNSS